MAAYNPKEAGLDRQGSQRNRAQSGQIKNTIDIARLQQQVDSLTVSGNNSADANFVFEQGTPSATWVVTHSLGKNPSVSVVDSAGTLVIGNVTYDTLNQLTLTFNGAFSGEAFMN